jgi:hypothetical protein
LGKSTPIKNNLLSSNKNKNLYYLIHHLVVLEYRVDKIKKINNGFGIKDVNMLNFIKE